MFVSLSCFYSRLCSFSDAKSRLHETTNQLSQLLTKTIASHHQKNSTFATHPSKFKSSGGGEGYCPQPPAYYLAAAAAAAAGWGNTSSAVSISGSHNHHQQQHQHQTGESQETLYPQGPIFSPAFGGSRINSLAENLRHFGAPQMNHHIQQQQQQQTLSNNGNNGMAMMDTQASNAPMQGSAQPGVQANGKDMDMGQTAFLGPRIWDKAIQFDEYDDVKLEYMDLEEFLIENELPISSMFDEQAPVATGGQCDDDQRRKQLLQSQQQQPADQFASSLLPVNNCSSQQSRIPPPPPPPPPSSMNSNMAQQSSSNSSQDSVQQPPQTSNDSGSPTSNNRANEPVNVKVEASDNKEMTSSTSSSNLFNLPDQKLVNQCSNGPEERGYSTFQDEDLQQRLIEEQSAAAVAAAAAAAAAAQQGDLLAAAAVAGSSSSAIRKRKRQAVGEDNKDDRYWERRRKNNMAAKRSRDARRAKENQIAMRATFLERENRVLTQELGKARAENHLLRERLCKYEVL